MILVSKNKEVITLLMTSKSYHPLCCLYEPSGLTGVRRIMLYKQVVWDYGVQHFFMVSDSII
jgi:hypothetical protein